MKSPVRFLSVLAVAAAGCGGAQGPSSLLTLRRVVLNQSGSGYFERTGRVRSDHLALRLRPHEVDDVLATLTVLEQGPDPGRTVVAAGVPHAARNRSGESSVNLDLHLPDARVRDLVVAYAVPTATWQSTYRVVLPEREGDPALLQVWALVHNSSDEDWRNVRMTLATGAPLSFQLRLRAPSFTSRPEVSGTLEDTEVRGPVLSENRSRETVYRNEQSTVENDREHRHARPVVPDGPDDQCPDQPEDRDGYQDEDGCPDPDNDQDGIADARDRCPDTAETFNGSEDSDGCPDQALVRVEATALRITQTLAFPENGSALAAADDAVLQAVAAALRGNPALRLVEVQGHASSHERNPWELGLERAAAVRARLLALGVEASRLRLRSYGATQPLGPETGAPDRARNRRVSFHLAPAADAGARAAADPGTAVTAERLSAGATGLSTTHQYLGATRYEVSAPVSIAAGSAALVTIASSRVPGEDVYLYRPEEATPSSRQHPYRAARLHNQTALSLLPGPVALFSGGTFAGQGLLRRLHPGEHAFVPYAIDTGTQVRVHSEHDREPRRILSVVRDAVALEDGLIERTRYTVQAGTQSPARMFIRYDHLPGYTPRGLPPGAEPGPESTLVPLPLTARHESTLALEQTRPQPRTLSLVDDVDTDLAPYLALAPAAVQQRLRAVLELRSRLARLEREAGELREQLADLAGRNAEIRETLRTLGPATDPGRTELRTRMSRQLQESMSRHEALSRDLATHTAGASSSRSQLIDDLRDLRIDAPAEGAAAPAP